MNQATQRVSMRASMGLSMVLPWASCRKRGVTSFQAHLILEVGHRVHRHPHNGDAHKHSRDHRDNFCGLRRLRLFNQIPQSLGTFADLLILGFESVSDLLVLCKLPRAEVLHLCSLQAAAGEWWVEARAPRSHLVISIDSITPSLLVTYLSLGTTSDYLI